MPAIDRSRTTDCRYHVSSRVRGYRRLTVRFVLFLHHFILFSIVFVLKMMYLIGAPARGVDDEEVCCISK